ncbi:MAG: hypothetical protein HC915_15565 [Anaerolineae bacterium]|nr:hypothetical protein [Anaerolineae bacterium]
MNLIRELFHRVQVNLLQGEALDIRYSQMPVEDLTQQDVLQMLWQKTGILYEFAGRAGAAIGLRSADLSAPEVERLAQFSGQCGTAFQLQDDVLGIVGDAKQLGKPVGSDIREGKRTVIVLESLRQMSAAERDFALGVLGNPLAPPEDVSELIGLLEQRGGLEHTRQLARQMIEQALGQLAPLPQTPQRDHLQAWAHYMIAREF